MAKHTPKAAGGFHHGHHGKSGMTHHKGAHHGGKTLVATPSNVKSLGGKGKA